MSVDTLRCTRLGSVAAKRRQLESALAGSRQLRTDLDVALAATECYFCLGAEGPICTEAAFVLACGHACHASCFTQARDHANRQLELEHVAAPLSASATGQQCGVCRRDLLGGTRIRPAAMCMKVEEVARHTSGQLNPAFELRRYDDAMRTLQRADDLLRLCERALAFANGPGYTYPLHVLRGAYDVLYREVDMLVIAELTKRGWAFPPETEEERVLSYF